MKNIKSLLTHIAPTLASALGGPFAGVAVKFMADKLGVKEGVDSPEFESTLEALLNDSGNLQKLQQLDHEFKLEMGKLNVDVFALEVEDRKDARALAKADLRPHVFLSIAFIVVYFFMLGWIFLSEVDEHFNPGMAKIENPVIVDGEPLMHDGEIVTKAEWVRQEESLVDLFKILLGVLTAGVGQVLNFWFGGRGATTVEAGKP